MILGTRGETLMLILLCWVTSCLSMSNTLFQLHQQQTPPLQQQLQNHHNHSPQSTDFSQLSPSTSQSSLPSQNHHHHPQLQSPSTLSDTSPPSPYSTGPIFMSIEGMEMQPTDHEGPRNILTFLSSCLVNDGHDINMDDYLEAYKEMSKFFHKMGSVFSFVSSDVDNKITILEKYRNEPDISKEYQTIKSMIEYEEKNDLLRGNRRVSGSRTALRLHRALLFFASFMESLSKMESNSATGPVARESYTRTLAEHHTWLVQKSASLAMYTMGNRDQLEFVAFGCDKSLSDFSDEEREAENALHSELMIEMADAANAVYQVTQRLYEDHQLLNLP